MNGLRFLPQRNSKLCRRRAEGRNSVNQNRLVSQIQKFLVDIAVCGIHCHVPQRQKRDGLSLIHEGSQTLHRCLMALLQHRLVLRHREHHRDDLLLLDLWNRPQSDLICGTRLLFFSRNRDHIRLPEQARCL